MWKSEKLSTEEKQTLEKFKALVFLTANKVGLKSLENFPELKNLKIVRQKIIYIIIFLFFIFLFSLN